MRKILLILLCNLLGVLSANALPSAEALVKAADESRIPNVDIRFMVSVTDLSKKKKLRETRYQVWTDADGNQSLVETVWPTRQKGRKLLMKEQELWFFTPDLQKPTRVSMQQRLTGEVANGDIARTNFSGDYTAVLKNPEKAEPKSKGKAKGKGKKEPLHLHLVAKRKDVTYAEINLWISNDKNFMPIRAEYFATSGRVLKTATFSEPKKILGRQRITKMTINDAVVTDRSSVLVYSQHVKEKAEASLFNKDNLVN